MENNNLKDQLSIYNNEADKYDELLKKYNNKVIYYDNLLSNIHNNYKEKLENQQKISEELKNLEIAYETKSSEFELMENNQNDQINK